MRHLTISDSQGAPGGLGYLVSLGAPNGFQPLDGPVGPGYFGSPGHLKDSLVLAKGIQPLKVMGPGRVWPLGSPCRLRSPSRFRNPGWPCHL